MATQIETKSGEERRGKCSERGILFKDKVGNIDVALIDFQRKNFGLMQSLLVGIDVEYGRKV